MPNYGSQTKLAVQNFSISEDKLPECFIHSLVRIKSAAAQANFDTGDISKEKAHAIIFACEEVLQHFNPEDFPVDVFQTGSGTSTNMNVNEVLANMANTYLQDKQNFNGSVHPNDDVNMGQSSNDTIPSALHMSAATEVKNNLLPSLQLLIRAMEKTKTKYGHIVKTGRTHLMDAMPLSCGQEISGWQTQIKNCATRFDESFERLCQLSLGGTAVGTGINASQKFIEKTYVHLRESTELPFKPKENYFEGLSCQDTCVELSGHLKVLAVALMKIANDLRWMGSGPLCGLAEVTMAELQKGSSIMPGKVNPVIPEAITMASAQIIGNDSCITVAGQSGQFQLNVMLPVITANLLKSLQIMANSCQHLANKVFDTLIYNETNITQNLSRNPILATALNTILGYDTCAKIAKEAYKTGKPIVDIAQKYSELSKEELTDILDPKRLI